MPAEAARKALVIGNGRYKAQPLAHPVNDATDMAARLEALGFAVTVAKDATCLSVPACRPCGYFGGITGSST